jgi:hypothetical protein
VFKGSLLLSECYGPVLSLFFLNKGCPGRRAAGSEPRIFGFSSIFSSHFRTGLPDGLFSNQKSQFG